MTKAEERKVLNQICELIKSTGADSYISMAFRGVPEYAERNIAEDAAYNPVEERDMWEMRCSVKDCELHNKNVELERAKQDNFEYRASTDKVIDDINKELNAWEQNAHDAGELYCELEKECAEKDAEIMRLKAEIYDLRKECGK